MRIGERAKLELVVVLAMPSVLKHSSSTKSTRSKHATHIGRNCFAVPNNDFHMSSTTSVITKIITLHLTQERGNYRGNDVRGDKLAERLEHD